MRPCIFLDGRLLFDDRTDRFQFLDTIVRALHLVHDDLSKCMVLTTQSIEPLMGPNDHRKQEDDQNF